MVKTEEKLKKEVGKLYLFANLMYGDVLDSVGKKKTIGFEEERSEGLRNEYFIKLKNFPIIRNKIYNLWLMRNSKKEIFKISQQYIKRVKWHIYRLYRTRNSIVHAGKVGYGLQMVRRTSAHICRCRNNRHSYEACAKK